MLPVGSKLVWNLYSSDNCFEFVRSYSVAMKVCHSVLPYVVRYHDNNYSSQYDYFDRNPSYLADAKVKACFAGSETLHLELGEVPSRM
jgi:hypothetical protein